MPGDGASPYPCRLRRALNISALARTGMRYKYKKTHRILHAPPHSSVSTLTWNNLARKSLVHLYLCIIVNLFASVTPSRELNCHRQSFAGVRSILRSILRRILLNPSLEFAMIMPNCPMRAAYSFLTLFFSFCLFSLINW